MYNSLSRRLRAAPSPKGRALALCGGRGRGAQPSWLPPRGKLAPVHTLVTDEGLYFFFQRCGNSRFTSTLIRHGYAVPPSPKGEGKGSLRRTGAERCAL